MAGLLVLDQLPREELRYQQVVRRMRDAIAQGRLAVGDSMPSERELCEQLGVSRTIVREALRILAAQGILTVHQGRRAVVAADLTTAYLRPMRQFIESAGRETLADVLDARLILEVACAERAALDAGAPDLAAMTEALDALRVARVGTPEADTAHTAFHRAVATASHNQLLARMVESLISSHLANDPLRASPAEQALETTLLPIGYIAHAKIFRPISEHRAAAARRAMHEHLSTTLQHHPRLHG